MSRAARSAAAAAVVALVGCGCTGKTPTGHTLKEEPVDVGRLRDAIVKGTGEDFRAGTEAGPKGFGRCLQAGLRRVLDRRALARLVSVAGRPHGIPLAAQALNELAVPVGDRCGGRQYVPELIAAAAALEGVRRFR